MEKSIRQANAAGSFSVREIPPDPDDDEGGQIIIILHETSIASLKSQAKLMVDTSARVPHMREYLMFDSTSYRDGPQKAP